MPHTHCCRCREPFKPDEKTLDIGLRDGYKICEKCQRELKIGVGAVEHKIHKGGGRHSKNYM